MGVAKHLCRQKLRRTPHWPLRIQCWQTWSRVLHLFLLLQTLYKLRPCIRRILHAAFTTSAIATHDAITVKGENVLIREVNPRPIRAKVPLPPEISRVSGDATPHAPELTAEGHDNSNFGGVNGAEPQERRFRPMPSALEYLRIMDGFRMGIHTFKQNCILCGHTRTKSV